MPEPIEFKDKHAVLINGCEDQSYTQNLELAYKVFSAYGFSSIQILDCRTARLSYPVSDLASIRNIEVLFTCLSKNIRPEDLLFLYTTGHGHRRPDIPKKDEQQYSTLELIKGELSESELEQLLQDVNPRTAIFLFDQCYGGGFSQRFGKNGNIAISASGPDAQSQFNTFPQAFFKYFLITANSNSRGSIQDAYEHTLDNDINVLDNSHRPEIHSEIDPATVFLA